MLRLSKLADYGTVVMVYLARHEAHLPHDKLCTARIIARHTHLSVPTVSKLLKILSHAGLLESQRGSTGGYKLSRAAEQISVAEIIAAVEERIGMTECSQQDGKCALQPVCGIRDNWQLLSNAITAALRSVTLKALAQPHLRMQEVDVSYITNISQSVE